MADRTGGHYDGRTIVLHWVTAALVAEQWIGAHLINDFAGFAKLALRSTHITFGLLLGLVLIERLIWRNLGGRHLRPSDPPLLEAFAKITHWGLYALLVVVVALGVSMVVQRGTNLFGVLHVPALAAKDRALGKDLRSWHATAANAILVLAGIHAAAALFHHYVWRDGVLRRMLPGSR